MSTSYWDPVMEDQTFEAVFQDYKRVSSHDVPEHRKHSRDPHGLGHGWYHLWVREAVEGLPVQPSEHEHGAWVTSYAMPRAELEPLLRANILWPPSGFELFREHSGRVKIIANGQVGSCTICYLKEPQT